MGSISSSSSLSGFAFVDMMVSLSTAPRSMIAGVEKGWWLQIVDRTKWVTNLPRDEALVWFPLSHHPPFDDGPPCATPPCEHTSGIAIECRGIRARSCQSEGAWVSLPSWSIHLVERGGPWTPPRGH